MPMPVVQEPILFLVPKKKYCSLDDVVYRVQMISPMRGILVDEGYVLDDSVGEDGSKQGDVVNGLFAKYEN